MLATGRQIEIEEEVPHAADIPQWYLSVKFPLRDSAGEVYAVCGISSDITELKRAQQELVAARGGRARHARQDASSCRASATSCARR